MIGLLRARNSRVLLDFSLGRKRKNQPKACFFRVLEFLEYQGTVAGWLRIQDSEPIRSLTPDSEPRASFPDAPGPLALSAPAFPPAPRQISDGSDERCERSGAPRLQGRFPLGLRNLPKKDKNKKKDHPV